MYEDDRTLAGYVEQHGLMGETLTPQELTQLTARTRPATVDGRDEELYLVDEAAGEVAVLRQYEDETQLVDVHSYEAGSDGVVMGSGVAFDEETAGTFVRNALRGAAASDNGEYLGGGVTGDVLEQSDDENEDMPSAFRAAAEKVADVRHPMRDD